MTKCSECGYENMDGLDYCDSCGAKLAPAAAAEAPAPAPGAPAPEHHDSGANGSEAAAVRAPAPEATSTVPEPASVQGLQASAVAAEAAPAPAPSAEEPTGELRPPPPSAPPTAPGAAPTFKAKLKITRGGRVGQEFPLEAGNNLIGRWDPETGSFPEVDMEQDDPEAKTSRKHALIRIEGDQITVEDIGSLNGTYVNRGQRLGPGNPVPLKNGDEVIVGKTFFKVIVEPIS
ncbi:MAG TPA: FHA domain-containing protein [Candidatus Binataceae bacterium]|nr:FHA domain-containing protein [Candidatus Binataceae bacterium]